MVVGKLRCNVFLKIKYTNSRMRIFRLSLLAIALIGLIPSALIAQTFQVEIPNRVEDWDSEDILEVARRLYVEGGMRAQDHFHDHEAFPFRDHGMCAVPWVMEIERALIEVDRRNPAEASELREAIAAMRYGASVQKTSSREVLQYNTQNFQIYYYIEGDNQVLGWDQDTKATVVLPDGNVKELIDGTGPSGNIPYDLDNAPNYIEELGHYLEYSLSALIDLGYNGGVAPSWIGPVVVYDILELVGEAVHPDQLRRTDGGFIYIDSADLCPSTVDASLLPEKCFWEGDGFQHQFTTLQATAAHEVFHHFQFSYETNILSFILKLDRWAIEGSAAWSEDIVFDESLTLLFRIGNYFDSVKDTVTGQRYPDVNLFEESYLASAFWKYLSERYNDPSVDQEPHIGSAVVRSFWEAIESGNEEEAIDAILAAEGSNLEDFFANQFAVANYAKDLTLSSDFEHLGYLENRVVIPNDLPGGNDLDWGYSQVHLVNSVELGPGESKVFTEEVVDWGIDYWKILPDLDTDVINLEMIGDEGLFVRFGDPRYNVLLIKDSELVGILQSEVGESSYATLIEANNYDEVVLVVAAAGKGGSYDVIVSGEGNTCQDIVASFESADADQSFFSNKPKVTVNIEVEDQQGNPLLGLTEDDFLLFEENISVTEFEVNPPSEGGSRLADIVFLIDNSGSMAAEQEDVRNNIINFVGLLGENEVDFALGLVRFGGENGGQPILEDNGTLTIDEDYFKDNVLERNITSGGTEPGYDAIAQAVSGFAFRQGSQKIFVIAMDEDPDQGDVDLTTVESLLTENDITLYVSTLPSLNDDFETLTNSTGGKIFPILDPFSEIVDSITEQVSSTYVITYTSPIPYSGSIIENREVRVSLKGSSCSVAVSGSYSLGSVLLVTPTLDTIAQGEVGQESGEVLTVAAEINTLAGPSVQSATLFYRNAASEDPFNAIEMTVSSGKVGEPLQGNKLYSNTLVYSADLPSDAMQPPGVSYYITAANGQSTVSIPGNDPQSNPFQVAVLPNEPPKFVHTPPFLRVSAGDLDIEAEVTDFTNSLTSVTLHYRRQDQITYAVVPMANMTGHIYQATIPESDISGVGLEYYIKATDNLGISNTRGTPDNPIALSPGLVPYGDPSADGAISAFDASLALQHAVQKTTLSGLAELAADVSGNAEVTTFDGALILQHVVGLLPCFPAEAGCAPGKSGNDVDGAFVLDQNFRDGSFVLELADLNGAAYSFQASLILETGNPLEIASHLPEEWLLVHHQLPDRLLIAGMGVTSLPEGTLLTISSTDPLTAIRSGTATLNEGSRLDIAADLLRPTQFSLSQSFPNPFARSTQISYQLPEAGEVRLQVFDALGRRVLQLVDKQQEAGVYNVDWQAVDGDGRPVASGVYYYVLEAGSFRATRSVTLLR